MDESCSLPYGRLSLLFAHDLDSAHSAERLYFWQESKSLHPAAIVEPRAICIDPGTQMQAASETRHCLSRSVNSGSVGRGSGNTSSIKSMLSRVRLTRHCVGCPVSGGRDTEVRCTQYKEDIHIFSPRMAPSTDYKGILILSLVHMLSVAASPF